jgi:outer membrane protein TolC
MKHTFLAVVLLLTFVTGPAAAVELENLAVLDLETAQRIALAQNPSLAAAEARVRQAADRVRQAQSAYWPRVDATVSGARVELGNNDAVELLQSARLFDPGASIDDPEDRYAADLTASWIVFDGFARKFVRLSALYGESQSQAARRDVQRLLLSAVATAFYTAQLAREDYRIAEADMAFNQRQLQDAEARERAGTGSLSDALNFKVRVNSAKTEIIRTRRIYESTLVGLAALMGLPDAMLPPELEPAPLAEETVEELSAPDPAPLLAYAQANRPDIHQIQAVLAQVDAEVEVARADYYPVVSVAGTVDGRRVNSPRFEGDDFGNSIGLYLSYNLFEGGLTRARVSEARHRVDEIDSSLEDLRINVTSEVRQAIAALVSAQEQVVLQRANVALTLQNRDLVAKEYAAGQTSLVRLNEAQRDLTTTQGRLALALAAMRNARYDLETATARNLALFAETLDAAPVDSP